MKRVIRTFRSGFWISGITAQNGLITSRNLTENQHKFCEGRFFFFFFFKLSFIFMLKKNPHLNVYTENIKNMQILKTVNLFSVSDAL